jgi:hypothetical protein
MAPVAYWGDGTYQKGIKLLAEELELCPPVATVCNVIQVGCYYFSYMTKVLFNCKSLLLFIEAGAHYTILLRA